ETVPPAQQVSPVFSVRALRSDLPSALAANWLASLRPPVDAVETAWRDLDVDGASVPIQEVSTVFPGDTHFAAALLVYHGRPARSVLAAQLATALPQLVHGTLPATMYIAEGIAHVGQEGLVIQPARAWLATAWRQHQSVCAR